MRKNNENGIITIPVAGKVYVFSVERQDDGTWHGWHDAIPGMDVYTNIPSKIETLLLKKVHNRECGARF
jgi:predicted heme/steroid binding protein